MDRLDDKIFGTVIGMWIVGALLSLGTLGVVIWGVISLVNWITSQNF